ncbi:MAG: WYL domain-containing protein [Clostridiales bacterium]|uniref:helix-turn-helix transcriptional regulator n=1 Tax=Flavonifractor porci TaxID=3133422 RepID=UPI003096A192|nr:WYL domain-containing protein [Clostridiales bacterium]
MKNKAQVRLQLLQKYLLEYTDEQHAASVSDILSFWAENGIQASRKSVYADIELLQDSGMDVICIRSTQNRYFVGNRLFELPELKLLVDAVESSHFITEKKSNVLIEKLGHLVSTRQAEQLNRHIYMDGMAKPTNEAIYYIIDALQTAIQEKYPISFQYYEYTQGKEKILKHDGYRYVFSPYVLIWNRDYYYVVGWSERHGKLAQFRVDRITGIEKAETEYLEDAAFDPAVYVREVFGMYNDDSAEVTLLCKNETMRSVIDRFGETVNTIPVDTKHFRAIVNVAPTPPFFAWIFTFGGAIRIEKPAAIQEKMREMAAWLCE